MRGGQSFTDSTDSEASINRTLSIIRAPPMSTLTKRGNRDENREGESDMQLRTSGTMARARPCSALNFDSLRSNLAKGTQGAERIPHGQVRMTGPAAAKVGSDCLGLRRPVVPCLTFDRMKSAISVSGVEAGHVGR